MVATSGELWPLWLWAWEEAEGNGPLQGHGLIGEASERDQDYEDCSQDLEEDQLGSMGCNLGLKALEEDQLGSLGCNLGLKAWQRWKEPQQSLGRLELEKAHQCWRLEVW